MKLQETFENGKQVLLYEGKKLTSTGEAYACGTVENPEYKGKYIDENGNRYIATWNTTEEWNNATKEYNEHDNDDDYCSPLLDDEANSCEWDSPETIEEA